MIKLLQAIRWPNLLMIAIAMVLANYFLLAKAMSSDVGSGELPFRFLLLLIIATVSIAAGGNIINDLCDVDIDAKNHPNRVPLRGFSEAFMQKAYGVFTGLGLAAGSFLAYSVGKWNLSIVFLLSIGALHFYSSGLKKKPFVGNLIVSLLSALPVFFVWGFDFVSLLKQSILFVEFQSLFSEITAIVILYSGFAFFLNLQRELVKDIEDTEGDRLNGAKTIPIIGGLFWSKIYSIGIWFLLLAFTFYYWSILKVGLFEINVQFLFGLTVAMTLLVGFLMLKARCKKDFSRISMILKVYMFLGVLSMLLSVL